MRAVALLLFVASASAITPFYFALDFGITCQQITGGFTCQGKAQSQVLQTSISPGTDGIKFNVKPLIGSIATWQRCGLLSILYSLIFAFLLIFAAPSWPLLSPRRETSRSVLTWR